MPAAIPLAAGVAEAVGTAGAAAARAAATAIPKVAQAGARLASTGAKTIVNGAKSAVNGAKSLAKPGRSAEVVSFKAESPGGLKTVKVPVKTKVGDDGLLSEHTPLLKPANGADGEKTMLEKPTSDNAAVVEKPAPASATLGDRIGLVSNIGSGVSAVAPLFKQPAGSDAGAVSAAGTAFDSRAAADIGTDRVPAALTGRPTPWWQQSALTPQGVYDPSRFAEASPSQSLLSGVEPAAALPHGEVLSPQPNTFNSYGHVMTPSTIFPAPGS